MPTDQFAYLGLVLFAFIAFIGGLLFVSFYSRKERAARTARIFFAGEHQNTVTTAPPPTAPLRRAA